MTKCLTEQGFILVHGLRIQFIIVGSIVTSMWHNWSHCIYNPKQKDECWSSVVFLLFKMKNETSLFSLCVWAFLPECKPVHHMCAWYSQRSEANVRSPGTVLADGCELLCGHSELNLGLLVEQPYVISLAPVFSWQLGFKKRNRKGLGFYHPLWGHDSSELKSFKLGPTS